MWRDLIDYFTIKCSGYFDPAYYLLHYPDCRLADIDPLWHFVRYGWREMRNPSDRFDTGYYLKTNPDVRQSGMNPLVHYLKYGQREGRSPHPSATPAQPRTQARHSRFRRALYYWGSRLYWAIPPKYRQPLLRWFYSHLGFLFKGLPDYEAWRGHCFLRSAFHHFGMIDLKTIQPVEEAGGRVAIHLHVFYPDLVEELRDYLRNMPFPYDLYVSVPDEGAEKACLRQFANLPFCRELIIKQVPNRGRNFAPLLCTFGKELSQYDYIAHLHTKKSLYNRGATEGWRKYLYDSLLGSPDPIRRIFSLMQGKEPCGIVYPQNYVLLPPWANTWLANQDLAGVWAARLGITELPRGYFDYPAGSMFWARTDALKPLFSAGIVLDDFPEEFGQTDGTLAHTIERLLVLCSLKQGLRPGIIKDEEHPSWSSWRFDLYINRPYISLIGTLSLPDIRLIAFDIFETLVCRPLLDPETVKKIVARRVGSELGSLYLRHRAVAEREVRQAMGRDVGLDEIYAYLGQLTGFSNDKLTELCLVEEEVEESLLESREAVLQLYKAALSTGKPVVLITDTFLPRERIERILRQHGIVDWKALFVSNDIGLRKDTGELYNYVLTSEQVKPAEFLMIGDNERSDIQIPCEMGASFIHLLRPVELARGLPRFAPIIAAHERRDDVDAEMTLGLVVRKNFSFISFPSFDPTSLVQVAPYNIGYSAVGPLLVSFANWLVQQALTDGIKRLYFLSREGRLMKDVYDCWCEGLKSAPSSDYLVISRRTAGVATIQTFEDILGIARMVYFPNTVENFLYTRYGLMLNEECWQEIERRTALNRLAQITVPKGGRIDHLVPLLRAVEVDILERAAKERLGLLCYLVKKGLDRDDNQAVVDVGYGGSVQYYLNRLLPRKVHGYYLMTDDRSGRLIEAYNVVLRGCFCENVSQSPHAPIMYRYSFDVERLLSSVEPQVEFYTIDHAGNPLAHYREMSVEERVDPKTREDIRRGALDYAKDARQIREKVLPDFQPSCWTAQMLLESLLEQRSESEKEFFLKLPLDDYYCGRDVVY